MRTAVLTAILSAFLLSLAACGDNQATGPTVVPNEITHPPTPTQPAK